MNASAIREKGNEGRKEGRNGGREGERNSLDSPHTNRGLQPLPGLQCSQSLARLQRRNEHGWSGGGAAVEEVCEENGFAFVRRLRRAHRLTDAYLDTNQVWPPRGRGGYAR